MRDGSTESTLHRSCRLGDCRNTFVIATVEDAQETMCPRCRLLVARAERDVARRELCFELAEPEVGPNVDPRTEGAIVRIGLARKHAEAKWGKDVALALFPKEKDEQ